MPGDFDFDADDEPVRGLSREARRAQTMGGWSLSIGGFVVLGGGLLALVATALPTGDTHSVGSTYGGRRVIWWALATVVLGGASIPVRRIQHPGGLDYFWALAAVVLGLVLAVFMVICGLALQSVVSLGIGGAAVFLSAPVIVGGSFLRLWEQMRKWGKANTSRRSGDDREEPPWRRPRREEEEDERSRRARRRREDDENEDEPPRKPRRRERGEEPDEPRPKPKAKPKEKPEILDLPDD